jgi:AraC family ethanolamine operon transcriptional activator
MALNDANVNRLTTSDLEAYSEAVSPNNVLFDQLSAGTFTSSLESIHVEGLLLYRERWNQRVRVTGTNPDGYVLAGVTRLPGVVWRGETLDTKHLVLNDASAEMDFTTGETADNLVMLVPADLLSLHLGEETCMAMQNARRPSTCDQRSIFSFTGTLRRVLNKVVTHGKLPENKSNCEAIQWELLDALAQVYARKHKRSDWIGRPKRKKALVRAMAYANDLQRPLRVPDLAKEVAVSPRTLEDAFREALGITPVKYLRWTRLNHVRRALSNAEPDSITIIEVATNCGFSDMSHMAVEYRHLFGESPSDTLARSRPSKH